MINIKQVFQRFVAQSRRYSGSDQDAHISKKDVAQTCSVLGDFALRMLIENYSFLTVLDIGSGKGFQADMFEKAGKIVTRFDNGKSKAYTPRSNIIEADFLTYKFRDTYDLIWACHVLEHQHNPNAVLAKISKICKSNGIIAITVPPAKPEFVGGHLTLWTPALLLYHLVLAGIDCKQAEVISYGYNISVITRNIKAEYSQDILKHDYDDIIRLKPFFPSYLNPSCRGDLVGNVMKGSVNFWKDDQGI